MRRGLGIIILTLLLGAAVAVSGSVLVLRAFYVWLLIVAVAWLWVILNSRSITVSAVAISARGQAGQNLRQDATVGNTSSLPKYGLELRPVTPTGIGAPTAIFNLPPKSTAAWAIDYATPRRGRYELGRFQAETSDPFGLLRREKFFGRSAAVIVHPEVVTLPPLSTLGLDGAGLSKPVPAALSASASSIREYTTGDSLRHVHWRSTAHTGRYMVKTFDADRSRHRAEYYWIILDMASSVHSGEGADSTIEYAVTLAATLAREYAAAGQRFGLLASPGRMLVLPPESGQAHLTAVLDLLAVVEAEGSLPLAEVIGRHQGLFGGDATAVIISPTSSSSLADSYHSLSSRGCAAAYFLIDGAGFGGSSPVALGRSLWQLGAPVYMLRRCDSFKQSLEQAAGAANWFGGASRS